MPELPEVETIRRGLVPLIAGRTITGITVREGRLRIPAVARTLRARAGGRRVLGVRRRAKYLLVDLERDSVLMVHLGMSGRLLVLPKDEPLAKHDHVLLELDNGCQLRFNDPRRFGLVTAFAAREEASHRLLAHLGPEPFDPALTAEALWTATRRGRVTIKSFVMDARRIVGVGNIYACEALFRAGIRPSTRVARVSRARWERLLEAVRATLGEAIEGGGTTLRDFSDVEGNAGYFAMRLRVYGREGEPCGRCARAVRRVVQGGRSTFYCPSCQP